MMAFLTMVGSRISATAVKYGAAIAATALVLWRIYASGQADQRAKQVANDLKNMKQREKSDEEAARMSADSRRDELSGWVRD